MESKEKRPKRWQCIKCNKTICFIAGAAKHIKKEGIEHLKFMDLQEASL